MTKSEMGIPAIITDTRSISTDTGEPEMNPMGDADYKMATSATLAYSTGTIGIPGVSTTTDQGGQPTYYSTSHVDAVIATIAESTRDVSIGLF